MAAIEALYIFDEHNNLILSHTYNSYPSPASTLLPLYLAHQCPRPSLIYLSSTSPPTLLHSILQDNLLFLSPSTRDTEPLAVLEFLHRVADALEEFLGSPLLASRITVNYDIVAQIVAEIADGGIPCQSEANALRDVVETGPGVLNNLLGKVGIPGSAPVLVSAPGSSSSGSLPRPLSQPLSSQGSAIPWRRSNVRHTSNEMYVDVVEEMNVVLAPSGRPLAAFANGSIAFTSKVSGVPDLLLTLSTGGNGAGMGGRGEQLRSTMERAVFHPCVRLNKWKNEGVLSFVPPDGRFALCGYEVDLLGPDAPLTASKPSPNINLPATIEMTTGVGPTGNEFEVRLILPLVSSSKTAAQASLQSNLGPQPGAFRASSTGDSKAAAIEHLSVRVPLPPNARGVSDLRPSRGEAHWNIADGRVEWKLLAKDILGVGGVGTAASLRCTVQAPFAGESEDAAGRGALSNGLNGTLYDEDDEENDDDATEDGGPGRRNDAQLTTTEGGKREASPHRRRIEKNRAVMPTSALLSFSIKGWLVSGLKVESLLLDAKASRGIGAELKPYKGVKYLTVSRDGVEVRC